MANVMADTYMVSNLSFVDWAGRRSLDKQMVFKKVDDVLRGLQDTSGLRLQANTDVPTGGLTELTQVGG